MDGPLQVVEAAIQNFCNTAYLQKQDVTKIIFENTVNGRPLPIERHIQPPINKFGCFIAAEFGCSLKTGSGKSFEMCGFPVLDRFPLIQFHQEIAECRLFVPLLLTVFQTIVFLGLLKWALS